MKKFILFFLGFTSTNQAFSQSYFCPDELIPYTFTLFEDVLMINRAYHRAFCQRKEGIEYECLEKWTDDTPVSVYSIHAKIDETGDLAFWNSWESLDQAPWLIPRCE